MKKIYSRVEQDKLLHIINRFEEIENRIDIVPEDQFLQVSAIKTHSEKSYRPHKHIVKEVAEKETITQESWVVIQGSVRITLYDVDDTIIAVEVITRGDSSITLAGGHGYEILEDNTVVYEYKTGPYKGQQLDKKFIG